MARVNNNLESEVGTFSTYCLSFRFGLFPLLGVHVPEGDGAAGAERGLDLVGIAPIRPEENHPIEDGLDVQHSVGPPLRENAQHPAVNL